MSTPTDAPPLVVDPAPTPWATILGFASSRLAATTYMRFPFTFITAVSSGLGMPITTTTALLGLRELPGIATPAVGVFVDRGHEKRTLAVATVAVGGASAATAVGSLPVVIVAMLVGGLGFNAMVMVQSAWIGHRVAFSVRGRAIGLVEVSWAAALLVGAPLCALLIDEFGWRTAFVVVGIAMVVTGGAAVFRLPADTPVSAADSPRPTFRSAVNRRTAGLYLYALCQPFAQIMVFAIYGDWFASTFAMSTAAIGSATVLIGIGELTGTLMTATVGDRIGTRRSTMIGCAVAAPLAAMLGTVGSNAALAVVLMVVFAIGIEFSFVSALPLMTEVQPEARGLTVGFAFALATVGRAVGSPLAGWTYARFGIGVSGGVAAVVLLVGIAAVGFGVRGHR